MAELSPWDGPGRAEIYTRWRACPRSPWNGQRQAQGLGTETARRHRRQRQQRLSPISAQSAESAGPLSCAGCSLYPACSSQPAGLPTWPAAATDTAPPKATVSQGPQGITKSRWKVSLKQNSVSAAGQTSRRESLGRRWRTTAPANELQFIWDGHVAFVRGVSRDEVFLRMQ